MNKTQPALRRAARRLRFVTLAATAVLELLILLGAIVALSGTAAPFAWLEVKTDGLAPLPGALALLAFGALLGLALFRLVALLREVEGGLPFPARALRGFALYLLLAVLVLVFSPPLLQLASGARSAEFSLDERGVLMLLVSSLLFFVARLLDEAQRLAEDHSQIV